MGRPESSLGPLSHSQAQTVLECEGKWRLRYVEKLRSKEEKPAPMLGRAVHIALAAYFALIPAHRSMDRLEATFSGAWEAMLTEGVAKLGEDWLSENAPKLADHYKRGLAMLGKFWNLNQNSPHIPACKVENEVSMPLGNTTFRAIPDAYFVTKARITILSHKTSPYSQPARSGNLLFNPQHIREAMVLSHLSPGAVPAFVRYYFLWPGGSDTREIPVYFEQIEQARIDLLEIAKRRDALAKQQRPTWNLRSMCERNCDYAKICLARVQLWNVTEEKAKWYTKEDKP